MNWICGNSRGSASAVSSVEPLSTTRISLAGRIAAVEHGTDGRAGQRAGVAGDDDDGNVHAWWFSAVGLAGLPFCAARILA